MRKFRSWPFLLTDFNPLMFHVAIVQCTSGEGSSKIHSSSQAQNLHEGRRYTVSSATLEGLSERADANMGAVVGGVGRGTVRMRSFRGRYWVPLVSSSTCGRWRRVRRRGDSDLSTTISMRSGGPVAQVGLPRSGHRVSGRWSGSRVIGKNFAGGCPWVKERRIETHVAGFR